MSTFRRLPSFAVALLATAAAAEERLVLFGGGERPAAAMARFVQWAGGSTARILVVPWASGEPNESYEALREDLARLGPAAIGRAPLAPLTEATKKVVDEALKRVGLLQAKAAE